MKIIKATRWLPLQLIYCVRANVWMWKRQRTFLRPQRCWEVSQARPVEMKTFFFCFVLFYSPLSLISKLLTNRKQHTNKVTKRPIYLFVRQRREKKNLRARFFLALVGMKARKKCLWLCMKCSERCDSGVSRRCSPSSVERKRKGKKGIIIIII